MENKLFEWTKHFLYDAQPRHCAEASCPAYNCKISYVCRLNREEDNAYLKENIRVPLRRAMKSWQKHHASQQQHQLTKPIKSCQRSRRQTLRLRTARPLSRSAMLMHDAA